MNCPTCNNETEPDAQFCGICGIGLSSGEVVTEARQPRVGFGEAISRGFKNYFNFNGRATRAEYWWWVLFNFLVGLIPIVNWVSWIIFLIPNISLTTRRLHDIGKTGWWQLRIGLLYLVPGLFAIIAISLPQWIFWVAITLLALGGLIGAVWLIVWMARQGDTGSNKYGPDPRATPAAGPEALNFFQICGGGMLA